MAKTLANIRVYGDSASAVYVSPAGNTAFVMPTTLATPASPFGELGWLGEDGVDLDKDVDVTEFAAWQGGTVVRKKVAKVGQTFKFQCLEETAIVMGLYYRGRTFTTVSGVSTMLVTNQAASDLRGWVIDTVDAPVTKRFAIPSGEVTGFETVSHKNDEMTIYQFEVSVYGDYSVVTNNPAAV